LPSIDIHVHIMHMMFDAHFFDVILQPMDVFSSSFRPTTAEQNI